MSVVATHPNDVDAEPFKAWLEWRLRYFGGDVMWFARRAGVNRERLQRILRGAQLFVSVDYVDRCLSGDGSTHIAELYPDLACQLCTDSAEIPGVVGSHGETPAITVVHG